MDRCTGHSWASSGSSLSDPDAPRRLTARGAAHKVRAVNTRKTRWPEITSGMIVGFLIGLPIAATLAGFVAWAATQRRAKELAEDYRQYQVVVVTQPVVAGEPLTANQVARRPVPSMVVSDNTVSPDEVNDLIGKPPSVSFEPGDLLIRSAFGLPPREPPAQETEADEGG